MTKKQVLSGLPLAFSLILTWVLYLVTSSAEQFTHAIDPVLVSIGPFDIRYYSLPYLFGLLAVYFVVKNQMQSGTVRIQREDVDTFVLWLAIGIIAGARLVEVIFYNPGRYLSEPLSILQIWEGGLSFHGGMLGIAVAAWLFGRKKKIDFFQLADLLVVPAFLFLALGRFTNFINGELYGAVTTLPWGVQFPPAEGFRHPVQIYEALKNFFGFGVLFFLQSFKIRRGLLTCLFLALYGGLRFFLEFFKDYQGDFGYTPLLRIPGINVAQVLCLVMVALAVFGFFRIYRNKEKSVKNSR